MKKSDLYIVLFTVVLLAVGIVGFSMVSNSNAHMTKGIENYTILETWELPTELDEISGIAWISHNTLACVQDEHGIIYIYDLDEKSVSKEIPFASNGDYEGIAKNGDDLYVIQSDGLLYEVKNWNATNKIVSSFETGFEASNNIESLTYSNQEKALLTVPKDKDIKNDYKGIYKIPMASKKVDRDTPLYKIDMNAPELKEYRHKKIQKTFSPSEIAVHPINNDIYILEGKNPKLMILNPEGVLKNIYKLDEINFPQPEGITFSDTGELYISNEAANDVATIHLVELKTN